MKATLYIVLAIVTVLMLVPVLRNPVIMFVYYAPIFTSAVFLLLCLTVASLVGLYRIVRRNK